MDTSASAERRNFQRGLTPTSIFAMILAALLFLPVSLYLNLVSGTTVAGAAVYLLALLVSELSRLAGKELKKQELFIIYSTVGGVAGFIPIYYSLVFKGWYVRAPFNYAYKLHGIPLPLLVPPWQVPPPTSPAYVMRTFLHPDWSPALIVWSLWSVINFLGTISLAMLFSFLFIEVEELPFPLAHISSSLVTTLTERKYEDMRLFLLGLSVGAMVSMIIYIPNLFGIPIIPLPWLDFTPFTETFLPGALIGLATTPDSFVVGLILPTSATASMLIGSIAAWILGNYLFLNVFPNLFPQWLYRYRPGMSLSALYENAYLSIWVQVQFGFSLGLMLFLIVRLRKSLVRMFKSMVKLSDRAKRIRILPPRYILLMYLGCTIGSVMLQHILVPDYPIWISLLASVFGSFLIAFISNASLGEIGIVPPSVNNWYIITYFSGYEGYPGWFFNPFIESGGSAGIVQETKVAYLTETKPSDYYKALIIGFALSLICSFIFMNVFWLMAPIPSVAYPYTLITWPVNMMTQNLFVTRQIDMSLDKIFYSATVCVVVGMVGMLLNRFHIPFSLVSFTAGIASLPPSAIMMFLGSFTGKYVFGKLIGEEKWALMKRIFVAGFVAGISIATGLGVAFSLLSKSTWILPY